MKLSEIFTQLTYGELSQISIGGGEAGQINQTNYDKMVAHTNLALIALYKRFPLKENRLLLELIPNQYMYPLRVANADTNISLDTKYIRDSISMPFIGDVNKVEKVFNVFGAEYPLNDESSPVSIFTPTLDVIRVTEPIFQTLPTSRVLEVIYRASHSIITVGNGAFNPENVEIDLPYVYLEPLLLYIASRVHNPTGMVNEFNMGNNYNAKYEQACQLLEKNNLSPDRTTQYSRLHAKGFV